MSKTAKILVVLIIIAGAAFALVFAKQSNAPAENKDLEPNTKNTEAQKEAELHPMAIEALRQGEYPGGDFVIEETLSNGSNYRRYIASYRSEGLKINGLLTVPLAQMPEGGYPAVIFVHGYIPPAQYTTTGSYPTYPSYLARSGFVVFKPDLRGHGQSEGEPVSAHYSQKYVIDTLYAINYLKNHESVNPERIGYWGHSNGGEIGLRAVLADPSIKAASFWGGVVGSYEAMFETYVDEMSFMDAQNPLTREFGMPSENPEFWNALEPYEYLNDITIPIELQHGINDESVPVELSLELKDALEEAGKDVTYFEYVDDHDISANTGTAWQRSINFFRENL